MKTGLFLAALAASVSFASMASAADVDVVIGQGVVTLPFAGPTGPIRAYNTPDTGVALVSQTAARNGNGSLEVRGDRSRYVIGNMFGTDAFGGGASQSLFKFSDLTSLTFDWQVGTPSTGTRAHNTPAVRVHIIDNGIRSEMIWEGVYNDGAAGQLPATGWQNAGSDSLFYLNLRSGPSIGVYTEGGSQVNRTIGNWQSFFSSNAYVTGLSFGAGSGFGSNFVGFVDAVNVRSPNGNNFAINFEVVPEPATWAMMVGGFGFVGAAARRRSSKVVFA